MIKAVIFDMDGVIVDTEPLSYKVNSIMVKSLSGKQYTEEFHKAVMGLNMKEVVRRMKKEYLISMDDGEFLKQRNQIFEDLLKTDLNVIEGFFPLIQYIKDNNLKCALATGNSRRITEKILHILDVSSYFESILCSEDIKKGKPDPWAYNLTMNRLGVESDETVILEDSKNGVLAALNSGSKVIIVNSIWRFEENSQIVSIEKDLTMVPKILKNLNTEE